MIYPAGVLEWPGNWRPSAHSPHPCHPVGRAGSHVCSVRAKGDGQDPAVVLHQAADWLRVAYCAIPRSNAEGTVLLVCRCKQPFSIGTKFFRDIMATVRNRPN